MVITTKKKKFNKKIAIAIVGIILFLSAIGLTLSFLVNKDGVYSIGVIYKTEYAGRGGGIRYYFSYYYKDHKYTSSAINNNIIKITDINRFVFVKFLPRIPSYPMVYPEIAIPSSIKSAPNDGWKELPVDVP